MKTVLTTSPEEAAAYIRSGGIAAFPTETVYGLGADVFNEAAIRKIFEAKQRPADNPLIAHISSRNQIVSLALEVTDAAEKLMGAFFPGPLTVVLQKRPEVPDVATAGLDTIGIRMPALRLAREFLTHCKTPVAAPSANLSGRPSPTTWQAVLEDLDGWIDCILQGTMTDLGIESTVVDCTGDGAIVLRPGSITLEQIRSIVPNTRARSENEAETARSPGLLHQHYSPRARVLVVDDGYSDLAAADAAFIGLDTPAGKFKLIRVCERAEDYAAAIYEFFRECDRRQIATIYCQAVDPAGVGAALMDRITRAAQR